MSHFQQERQFLNILFYKQLYLQIDILAGKSRFSLYTRESLLFATLGLQITFVICGNM